MRCGRSAAGKVVRGFCPSVQGPRSVRRASRTRAESAWKKPHGIPVPARSQRGGRRHDPDHGRAGPVGALPPVRRPHRCAHGGCLRASPRRSRVAHPGGGRKCRGRQRRAATRGARRRARAGTPSAPPGLFACGSPRRDVRVNASDSCCDRGSAAPIPWGRCCRSHPRRTRLPGDAVERGPGKAASWSSLAGLRCRAMGRRTGGVPWACPVGRAASGV